MNRLTFTRTLAGIGLALSIGACTAPDLTPPCPIPPDADEATRKAIIAGCFGGEINNIVETKLKKDVDILFVVDNSTSMTPKQRVLAGAIPQFINAIEKFGSDYHVGIVSTDVGANPTSTSAFPGNRTIPGCASFSGDDGKLQNTPCTLRMGVSTETVNACSTLCPDPKFVPSNGGRYIEKKGTVYNVPSAKDAMNNEIGPQKAFQCIALVGDGGCGVESPLESAKRALDGHLNENSGFLRQNSVLAVIFITDEDDSANDGSKGTVDGWKASLIAAKKGDETALVVLGLFGDGDKPDGICPPFDPDNSTGAEPSPRLRQFVDSFGERGVAGSVCADSYKDFFMEAVGIIDSTCDGFVPPPM